MVSTPFVPVPPHHYGGTELVVYELVEGLLDRGHEVTLFATGDSRTRAPLCSLYPSAQWPPGWFADLNHSAWSLHEVAQDKFDVVHAHSAAALALGRFSPDTPMVYTLHHAHEPELSAYYEQFPEVAFVAISGDQCRRERGATRRTVIHHGLDPSRFRWTHAARAVRVLRRTLCAGEGRAHRDRCRAGSRRADPGRGRGAPAGIASSGA